MRPPICSSRVSRLASLTAKEPGLGIQLRDLWLEDYAGDRVKALMSGLLVMHMAAFNHKTEFYLLTEMDAQKLYNAARNTEAVVWKLSNAKNVRGELILLSNGFDANGVANLSFEREFGKLIGIAGRPGQGHRRQEQPRHPLRRGQPRQHGLSADLMTRRRCLRLLRQP